MDVTVNWKVQDLDNKGVFYTDSNGLYMVKREADAHIKKYGNSSQRASSNYYPINTGIMVEDEKKEV